MADGRGGVRAFWSPGREGEGEIQVFISVRDGVETVSALEVVHEIPQELAITRSIGDTDAAARGRDFLRDGEDGTTVLEHGSYFTLPAEAARVLPSVRTAVQATRSTTCGACEGIP